MGDSPTRRCRVMVTMNRGDNSSRRGEPLQLSDPAQPPTDRPASDDGAERAVVDRPSPAIRERVAEARPEAAS